jgi:hypothetical protein
MRILTQCLCGEAIEATVLVRIGAYGVGVIFDFRNNDLFDLAKVQEYIEVPEVFGHVPISLGQVHCYGACWTLVAPEVVDMDSHLDLLVKSVLVDPLECVGSVILNELKHPT